MSQNPHLNPFYNILKQYNPSYLTNHQEKLKQFGVNNINHYFQPPVSNYPHPIYGMPRFPDFMKYPYIENPNYHYQHPKYNQFLRNSELPLPYHNFAPQQLNFGKKPINKNDIIQISDDQDDIVSTIPAIQANKDGCKLKVPNVVKKSIETKIIQKQINAKSQNTLQNEEIIFVKKLVKQKIIKKQKIKLVTKETIKNIKRDKQKSKTCKAEKQEKYKIQQANGRSRIGKQFQCVLPEMIFNSEEKQYWIHVKKKNLLERLLKQY